MLFWLKLISFIIAAVLGIVGTMTDFKDDKHKMTKPGKWNLTGLVLAAIISVVAQTLDERQHTVEEQRRTAAANETNDKLAKLVRKNEDIMGGLESVVSASSPWCKSGYVSKNLR